MQEVVGTADDRAAATKLDEAIRRVNQLIAEMAMKGLFVDLAPTETRIGSVVTHCVSHRVSRPILPL